MLKFDDPVLHIFEEHKALSRKRGSVIPENRCITGLITLSSIGKTLTNIVFTPQPLSANTAKKDAKRGRDSKVREERGYTPQQAIKRHCKDCAGEKPKEILLCNKADCPLWSYRFGFSINDKRFGKKMRRIWKSYPENYAELREVVINLLENTQNSREKASLRTLLRAIDSGAE